MPDIIENVKEWKFFLALKIFIRHVKKMDLNLFVICLDSSKTKKNEKNEKIFDLKNFQMYRISSET